MQHHIANAGPVSCKLQMFGTALYRNCWNEASASIEKYNRKFHKFQTYVDANYLPLHRHELCLLIHAEIFFINHEDLILFLI